VAKEGRSIININETKNNNKMLFQYKANEELVRSVYKNQMGEKSSGQLTNNRIRSVIVL
jgi:CRISPR/Cas system endoribonuclease Cas6 (RAMP superfamily)